MKCRIALQGQSSLQAHSRNLRLYVQIGLSEQGKVSNVSKPTKNNKRLIQQCFKQVLEPICEAHFSKHSYGFRLNCSVENAIADKYYRLQKSHLHYVIEFDIKSFFDNVNHVKLIRQMWTLGIRDKHFLGKILRMLKTPIKMPSGELKYPTKGTPQGD